MRIEMILFAIFKLKFGLNLIDKKMVQKLVVLKNMDNLSRFIRIS